MAHRTWHYWSWWGAYRSRTATNTRATKKGLKFNERNRWTATIHTGLNPTANDVAKKLANQINNNTVGHGIKASVADAKITLTAESKGIDYEILGADELVGIAVTVKAHGLPAYGDAAYITDLANKAAADAGIEYTYRDTYTELDRKSVV